MTMSRLHSGDLSHFKFEYDAFGAFSKVTYTTKKRGDYWVAYVAPHFIDDTYRAECAKVNDLKRLRGEVKRNGRHYSKTGNRYGEPTGEIAQYSYFAPNCLLCSER